MILQFLVSSDPQVAVCNKFLTVCLIVEGEHGLHALVPRATLTGQWCKFKFSIVPCARFGVNWIILSLELVSGYAFLCYIPFYWDSASVACWMIAWDSNFAVAFLGHFHEDPCWVCPYGLFVSYILYPVMMCKNKEKHLGPDSVMFLPLLVVYIGLYCHFQGCDFTGFALVSESSVLGLVSPYFLLPLDSLSQDRHMVGPTLRVNFSISTVLLSLLIWVP